MAMYVRSVVASAVWVKPLHGKKIGILQKTTLKKKQNGIATRTTPVQSHLNF